MFMPFVEVAKLNEVPNGKTKKVVVNNEDIMLANVDGKIYAIEDRCGHMGVSLAAGKLSGKYVICAFHGATVDVTTGKVAAELPEDHQINQYLKQLNLPIVKTLDRKSFEVEVEGNTVKIKV